MSEDLLREYGLDDENEDLVDTNLVDKGLGAFTSKLVEDLIDARRTEVHAPEILQFRDELVTQIKEKLDEKVELVDDALEKLEEETKNPQSNNAFQEHFTVSFYQMDMERVRYSLARYLRTRILKIERNLYAFGADLEMMDRLSFNEKQFVTQLNRLNESYFAKQMRDKIQTEYRQDDLVNHSLPNLKTYIFLRPKEDIELGDDEERKDYYPDDIVIAEYAGEVRDYVLEDKVSLL